MIQPPVPHSAAEAPVDPPADPPVEGSVPEPVALPAGVGWRRVTVADAPVLREICLRTGDSGRDASARTRFPDLLGDVYAAPYAVHEAAFGTVVEDAEGVAGYLLGCRDTLAFEGWREREWWPPLRSRYPRPTEVEEGFDSGPLRIVHSGVAPDPVWTTHPSHLHVDLLPRLQGRGIGRALLHRLFAALAADGSPGVHLGVSAANPGAVAFYRRSGLQELAASPDGYTFGRSFLSPGSGDVAGSGSTGGFTGS